MQQTDTEEKAATDGVDAGLDNAPSLIATVRDALAAGDTATAAALVEPMHAADLADLLQDLASDQRCALIHLVATDRRPGVLAELDETVRDELIAELGVDDTAHAVAEMETDDALHVIGALDEEDRQRLLEALPSSDRLLLEEALSYPEYSAGRLMQREVVAVPTFWTVGQTIEFLRRCAERDPDRLPKDFYDIYVVDPAFHPVGSIPLSLLLRSRQTTPVTELMTTSLRMLNTDTDQEEVAFLFRQRDLTSAPVVNADGRLVGVITIDDVVDVIDEEFEDDIMHLGGVSADDLYRHTLTTVRLRFSWLLVNLATAVLASLVIGLFEATIAQVVALAVLMPIVASMGGNAGTQTLTVAVRALAMKELTPANALRVIAKELMVGAINGFLFAVIAGVIAWLWFGSLMIAAVIGLAMIANLIVAGLGGAAIPLLLERLRIDPAVASAVFLTTLTDVVGFFVFLGLAAWLLV
jgi:magnesium transporter